ncbi:hypothetical protein EJ04DRAFT_573536 [Polyplosphaeria fusca]|uniref:Calcofluor white hypersensitive protein n=1 Tax=Polyplosphaeria fusca TaxID=682080 RepID=A0A9P4R3W9_9PLEO|nr:hypothetical protein EJ04DRAFT_573536 [Polyplosphaeria fusca]
MSRRIVTFGGLAAAGGAAYYLYNAGGDPKLAEKQLEHDAAAATRKIKNEVPGREQEAKKAGEEGWETIKKQTTDLSDRAKAEANKADAKFDQYRADAAKKFEESRQETGNKLNSAVDTFDKNVAEGANKSKSWIGSWFGGK